MSSNCCNQQLRQQYHHRQMQQRLFQRQKLRRQQQMLQNQKLRQQYHHRQMQQQLLQREQLRRPQQMLQNKPFYIKSMKESYLAELNDLYQKIASKVQQHDSLPQRPHNEQIEKLKMFKFTLERIVLFLWLNKQDIQHSHKEKLASVEKHISFFLSSNRPRSKPSSSPLQGQSSMQLQQPQSVDGQTNPSMQPIPGSMAAMPQNNLTNLPHNSLSGQNLASSGQNALGPEMTMEATSYEPTSGPEDSDVDAKEEEDGDVSKEDVGEEVVVRKEQNSFVGHTENARIGENEESSSNEAIGRPSVFFK